VIPVLLPLPPLLTLLEVSIGLISGEGDRKKKERRSLGWSRKGDDEGEEEDGWIDVY